MTNIKISRKKEIIFSLMMPMIVFITVFIVGEIFARIYFPEPANKGQLCQKKWNLDYKKPALIPNAKAIHEGVLTKINSLGLKNKEINLVKDSNTIRISMFGDSFTYGQGLPIDETLPSQLERRLNKNNSNLNEIQVLNFGVFSANTFQEVMYALNYGLKFNPDIVFIVWLYNDIEMNGYMPEDFEYFTKNRTIPRKNERVVHEVLGEAVGSYKGSKSITMRFWNFYEKLKKKSRFIFIVGMRAMRLLQNFGLNLKKSEEIVYSDLGSDGFQLSFNSLKFINDQLNELNIEFYVAIYPPLRKLEDDYYNDLINKKVQNWCVDNNIHCLNLFDFFRGQKPSRLHISRVDAHPNGFANAIAAKAIEEYLKEESRILE